MRCYDMCLLQLLLGAALSLLMVQARSLNDEELQHHALSGQGKGTGDEVISAGATKDENSKEPVKKVTPKDIKGKFDPDSAERKLAKSKSKGRSKRNTGPVGRRQKGRPVTGRQFPGIGDLGGQIRSIIEGFSPKKTESSDHSGGLGDVGDIVSALSDAISQSQQQVEDQVTVLREENSVQLSAVVAAVNQSADSLASLAETAEETHGFLQTIAHSLGSINTILHHHLMNTPIIEPPIPPMDTTPSPDATCGGNWKRVGSDCIYVSSQGPWFSNQPITKLSWYDAREACQNEGGALLEPTNIYTLYDYLKENDMNHDYWIGGSDMNEDGDWQWVSGRPIVSDAWSAQPRRDIFTNCLNFSTNEALPLSSGDCDDISYYLCQQQPVMYKLHPTRISEEPVLNATTDRPAWSFSMKWSSVNATERPTYQGSCEEPSFKVGSECFMIVDEQKSWHDARSYCQAEGYDLAEPENIETLRQYLLDEGFGDDYWVGGTDEANEGEWLWLSGRLFNGDWMEGQPSDGSGGDQNCLDFQSDQNPFFNDYYCSHEQRFICERELTEQPADGGSMALEADSFINLLQEIIAHPELAMGQNETKPSMNITETTDANNELNNLFQLLNLLTPSENTMDTLETTDSNNGLNGLAGLISLFKPSESSTESPGDAFSNNMNSFIELITGLSHGTLSEAEESSTDVISDEPSDVPFGPSYMSVGSERFLVRDEKLSWSNAKRDCESQGGYLAEPNNITVLRDYLIKNNYDDDYWIGGSDQLNEGSWIWATSGDLIVDDWMEDQPSGEKGQNCLDFRPKKTPSLNDYNCDVTQKYICQAEWCGPPLKLVGDECFFISDELVDAENAVVKSEMTWTAAQEFCKENGGDLAEPSDPQALREIMTDGIYYWIGSKYNESEAMWKWVSGKNVVLSEYSDARPGICGIAVDMLMYGDEESSVGLDSDDCDRSRRWICEKPNPSITPSNATDLEVESCMWPYEEVGSQCLFVGENEVTWQEAQERCRDLNGSLAEITQEQNTVIDFLSRKAGSWTWAWIARTSMSNSDEWLRSRSSVRGRWVEVPDDNYDGCLKLGVEYGGYKPYNCMSGGGHYICERKVSSTDVLSHEPSDVPFEPSYMSVGSELFLVRDEKLSWSNAQRDCENQGGYLAEPNNITVLRDYLIKNNYDGDYWIGGSDKLNEGSWVWAKSGDLIVDDWMKDQPSGEEGQNCLDFQPKKTPSLNDYNCDVTQKYICQKLSSTDTSFEPSYMSVGSELFLVRDEKLSWSNAQRDCESQGGYLAEPNNITVLRNYLIKNNYNDDYWIGGSDQLNEGSWIWANSGDLIVDDWMEDQPGGRERQNCLDFQPKKTPSLNDYSCDVTQKHICQKATTSSGTGHGNYTRIGTELFLVVKEKLSWHDARENCKQNGGDLASPKNIDLLQNYVKEEGEEHDYWLGGSDEAEEGTWTWLSGETIVKSWKANQPSGGRTQNCLDFRSGHTPSLNDYECDEPQFFICQTDGSSPVKPPNNVEPTTTPALKHEDCNEPYFQIGNECFLIVNEEKAWHFAREYCQRQGDHLADPSKPDELADYLQKNQLVRDYWLGATDEVEEGSWISVTGDSIVWTGTPPVNKHENCLDFRADRTPSYHDYFCENEQQFICERGLSVPVIEFTTTMPEESCGDPYVLVGAECFKIVHYSDKNWDDARDDCLSIGGDLATPQNITNLITYLIENERTGDYWLGGTDIDEEGTWRWLSGEEITTGWSGGVPRIDDTENCLDFRTTGFSTDVESTLHDYYCSTSQKYICEKSMASTTDLNGVNEQFAAIKFPSHDDLIDDGLIINEQEETINYPNHNENKITYPETSPSNIECRDTRMPGMCVLTLEGGSCSCAEAKENGLCINSPHTQKTCRKTCGLCSFPDVYPPRLITETSKCTIHTFIGLARSEETVETELTLIKEYGRSETINVTNEDSHTFKGVDPGHYTLCVETKVAGNQLSKSNCSNVVVEEEAPGIPKNVQAIGYKNGSISVVWEVPDDSSCPANKYRVQLTQGLHNDIVIRSISTAKLIANFDNVIPGITYSIRVNAENALGEGDRTSGIVLTVPTESCEQPFFALGETCYQIVQGSYNWFQARQLCQEQDAELVQNHSLKSLHNYLRDHDDDYVGFWMGASDENEEGNREWISGKPISQPSFGTLFVPEFSSKNNCTQLIFDQNDDYNSDQDSCYNIEISNIICEKPMIPSNVENLYTQLGSEHFLIVKESVSWARAQEICKAKGGDLAQPDDLDLLRNWINESDNPDYFWLGASDMRREGDWEWLNGSNVEHGWMKREPDNRDGSENCLLFMTRYNPSLNDHDCRRSESFICELNKDEEDPFISVGDEKFLVVEDWKSWEEARTSCQSFGGDLAEPKDLELLKRHLSENAQDGTDYWIGGTDSESEGSWKWVSGTVVNTSLWIDGEPDGDDFENCLDFQPQEKPSLNDYECDETQYYICEKTSEKVISDVSDESCSSPFVQLGSECFLIVTDHDRTWQDARDYCQMNDADLAIPNYVRRLRKYLVRNDLEYDYWVGGSQQNSDSEWLWVNGDPFAEEWRDGEPDDGIDSRCIDFQSQYRPSYNAYRCSGEQSFICEKPTISGKSVYDNKDKHPNKDLSNNFEKTGSLDESTEETTEEIGTTVFSIESTDYSV